MLEDLGCKCCTGVILGIVFYGMGMGLGGWNEYRNVATIKTISLAEDFHISVNCNAANNVLDTELIHFSCEVTGESSLGAALGVIPNTTKGFALQSLTEVYRVDRKEEKVKCNTNDKQKNCKEETFHVGWHQSYESIPSGFEECRAQTGTDCQNKDPRTKYWWAEVQSFGEIIIEDKSENAMVGSWHLPRDLLQRVWIHQPLSPSCDLACPTGSEVRGQTLYYKYDSSSTTLEPQIGDVRVQYFAMGMGPSRTVSVLAEQGDTTHLFPWASPYDEDYTVYEARVGTMTAARIFEAMRNENAVLTWGLRLGTLIMTVVGINCILSPVSQMAELAEVVPFLGDMVSGLVDCALCIFSGCVGCMCWFFVVALCWVAYRPMVGIPCLIVSMVMCAAVVVWRTQYKDMGRKLNYDLDEGGGDSIPMKQMGCGGPPPGFNFCPQCGQHKPAAQQMCKACADEEDV